MSRPRKSDKIRTEFRKRHDGRVRKKDFTRDFREPDGGGEIDALADRERLSGKGELTRKKTVVGHLETSQETGFSVRPDVEEGWLRGRVLSVHGLYCRVQDERGVELEVLGARVLKSLATELRHVVVTGDRVAIEPDGVDGGVIARIEPRRGIIESYSRGRRHVIAANVDRLLIVASAAEPGIKPHLIDRLLVTAERAGVEPTICVNKVDLVDLAELQPLFGVYGRMGYRIVAVSARTGFGMERLRRLLRGRDTVVAGQSGVGKSSLLNVLEPGLNLRVSEVSRENQKGKHTTTAATLVPLAMGGHLVDTPGIRSFPLWNAAPAEIAGWFRDVRPFVNHCRFPDCTHTHEERCGVKEAVADNLLDLRRYDSLLHLQAGDEV